MATFIQGFEPSTSTNGQDLLITDTSVYDNTLPKTVFTSRTVVIEKSDGSLTTVDFPYTNTVNATQDVLTISEFYDKDYVVTITVTWQFNNEGTPDTAELELDYLSNYNALIGFVTLADQSDCSCDAELNATNALTMLNNYIENAVLWAKYDNLQKSQKFLDNCKDLLDSVNDCNTNA